jgi:zinc transporter, ZIP family
MGLFLGEVALSTYLIVRFTLHNRSERLAIVTPVAKTEAKKRTMIR